MSIRAIYTLFFPVLFALPLWAQAPNLNLGEKLVSTPAPAQSNLITELASPRDTLHTFMEAMHEVREGRREAFGLALKSMDLSSIPEFVRESQGRELAIKLLGIINRTRKINYEKIPNRHEGAAFVLREDSDGILSIERQTDGWRFSSQTVLDIPRIFSAIENQKPLEGLEEDELQSLQIKLRRMVPIEYKRRRFLIEDWQWLVLFAFLLISKPLHFLFSVPLHALAKLLGLKVQDLQSAVKIKSCVHPLSLLLLAYLAQFTVNFLGLAPQIYTYLTAFLSLLKLFAAIVVLYRLVDVLSEYLALKGTKIDRRTLGLLVPIMRRTAQMIILICAVFFAAQVFSINVTGIAAGLGLGGLALALAAKDTVENLFGSLTVLIDRPFSVGDLINIDGMEGTVEDIGLRSTRLRTPNNSVVTVPNSRLTSLAVDNLGARYFWRVRSILNLSFQTSAAELNAFCEGVQELIRLDGWLRQSDSFLYLHQMGPSGFELLLNLMIQIRPDVTEASERQRFFLKVCRLAQHLQIEFVPQAYFVPKDGAALTTRAASDANLLKSALDYAGQLSKDSSDVQS